MVASVNLKYKQPEVVCLGVHLLTYPHRLLQLSPTIFSYLIYNDHLLLLSPAYPLPPTLFLLYFVSLNIWIPFCAVSLFLFSIFFHYKNGDAQNRLSKTMNIKKQKH